MRALDWFFNGGMIDDKDLWFGSTEQSVRVRTTFENLTAADRDALGKKYAPETADTFTAWRTWSNGQDKMTGNAMVFPAFEDIRNISGATSKREAWNALIADHADLSFPKWSSAAKIEL